MLHRKWIAAALAALVMPCGIPITIGVLAYGFVRRRLAVRAIRAELKRRRAVEPIVWGQS